MKRRECMVPYQEDLWSRGLSPWNHLSRMERDLYDLGRQMTSWDRDFSSLSNVFNFPGWLDRSEFFTPAVESHVSMDEKTGKYTMNIPLGRHLGPEDVKVSLKDHVMTIEAHKEKKSEDGRCRSYQEFMRKFNLPENVRDEEVKSMLTPEGYLKIEAPIPHEALPEPPKPKEIPINYT